MSGTLAQQFRKAVKRALPAVVMVSADEGGEIGSGVIIRPEGVILTNAHVVGKAKKVTVKLQDRRSYTCERIYKDTDTDIAILKLDLTGNESLPFAQFGKSDDVEIGDWVLAMGCPYGLNGTVTAGIVSAKGRTIQKFRFEDFIQIDAAVNPGSSGGPLVDSDGDIVGLNTAIKSKEGTFQGIAFAVPTTMLVPVAETLIRDGKIVRGYIGAHVEPADAETLKPLGLTGGLIITSVKSPASPAGLAGLRVKDVVASIDGTPVPDLAALSKVLFTMKAGQQLTVSLYRAGKPQTLTVTVAEPPTLAPATTTPAARPATTPAPAPRPLANR
jgi:serine protease Do